MTDDELDAVLHRVEMWRTIWSTYSGEEYSDLRRACNDIVELVSALRNERTTHKATRAELEEVRGWIEEADHIDPICGSTTTLVNGALHLEPCQCGRDHVLDYLNVMLDAARAGKDAE